MKIALFCESPPPSCTVWVGVLTRSLSAAGSAFPTPKSSAVTSWDVWPWHSTVSRPTNSSPRSIAEANMVQVVRVQVARGLSGSAEGDGCREVAVGPRDSSPSTLSYTRFRAPPGGTLLDLHAWLLAAAGHGCNSSNRWLKIHLLWLTWN